jgi:hypothetical protein
MSARLLALVCLLQFGLCIGWSEPVIPPDHELVVYLRAGASRNSASLASMQAEVSTLMRGAGYHVTWRIAGESSSDVDDATLVVVDLRGACQAPSRTAEFPAVPQGSILASTAVADGHILPFSWVNCDTLTALLGHSIAGPQENQWYGRAIGRLLAHEFYHILTQEREHADSGVAKSAFNVHDLLAEHFDFEQTALVSPSEHAAGAAEESASR